MRLKRTLIEVLALMVVAVGAAVIANESRSDRLPMRLSRAFYSIESGARPILLPEAARIHEQGRAIFLDARPGGPFAQGQIDGALSVPAERWRDLSEEVLPWIEGQRVVVYADAAGINPADDLAGSILARGIPRDSVLIYIGGIEEWRAAGLAVREGASSILSEGGGLEPPGESDDRPPSDSPEEPPR